MYSKNSWASTQEPHGRSRSPDSSLGIDDGHQKVVGKVAAGGQPREAAADHQHPAPGSKSTGYPLKARDRNDYKQAQRLHGSAPRWAGGICSVDSRGRTLYKKINAIKRLFEPLGRCRQLGTGTAWSWDQLSEEASLPVEFALSFLLRSPGSEASRIKGEWSATGCIRSCQQTCLHRLHTSPITSLRREIYPTRAGLKKSIV